MVPVLTAGLTVFTFFYCVLTGIGCLHFLRTACAHMCGPQVILYSFYKNIALVISLFLFNFYNGYSGTTLFESFVMAGWNFFLALPIIAIGIYDTDVSVPLCSSL